MAKDLKRLERRREQLREVFLAPSVFEAPVGDAPLDIDRLEKCLATLADRGLFDKTLIVWAGEIWRAPRIRPRSGMRRSAIRRECARVRARDCAPWRAANELLIFFLTT